MTPDWPGDTEPLPHAAAEDRLGVRLAGMVGRAPMRAITVRQPWAGAIIWRGKGVENRSRNIAGGYRGAVAIHVAQKHDFSAVEAHNAVCGSIDEHSIYGYGAFIGVVDLVSVHHDSDHGPYRCSPWALPGDWHLMVANPRPLPEPIPARGMLGLWMPSDDQREQIEAAQ